MQNNYKTYIAGGCFWGMEELFRTQIGVIDTKVGYIGGSNENPTYDNHTGHAEGLEIIYNPEETCLENILSYFFRIHNPTTKNKQVNDIGSSYRSAIFFQDDNELQIAKDVISMVNNSGKWSHPVVTTLEPFIKFWSAETYHQDYLQKNPGGYTCHIEHFESFE